MDLDVQKAVDEVLAKSDVDIERETAWAWATRSIACYVLFRRTGSADWLIRADRFKQEAVEHAALVLDHGQTVAAVEDEIEKRFAEARGA
jgi:hypothetical protein